MATDSGEMLGANDAYFDVCIAGTGLIECLVAASLSVRGYKILHIDEASYYGGSAACFSLNSLEDWIKQHPTDSVAYSNEFNSFPQLDVIEKITVPSKHLTINMTLEELRDNCIEYDSTRQIHNTKLNPQCSSNIHHSNKFETELFINRQSWFSPFNTFMLETPPINLLLNESDQEPPIDIQSALKSISAKFNIDLSPKLLYSESVPTTILVTSGVCRYIEFRALNQINLLILNDPMNDFKQVTYPLNFESPPDSKSAVFQNPTLSLVEKRQLMKFITSFVLQSIHKLSESISDRVITDDQHTLDVSLDVSKGGTQSFSAFLSPSSVYSLANKSTSHSIDARTTGWTDNLKLEQLSHGLRQRLTYGVCLKTTLESMDNVNHLESVYMSDDDWDMITGLQQLYRYSSSFGKYSNGSFIFPSFGFGDIPQAFARLSAVYRGVFMLRTGILNISVPCSLKDSHKEKDKTSEIDETLLIHHTLPSLAGCNNINTDINNESAYISIQLTNGQTIQTQYIVSSIDHLKQINDSPTVLTTLLLHWNSEIKQSKTIKRFVTILDCPLLQAENPFRFLTIILNNQNPIHLLQLDSCSGCCPDGYFLVYFTQVINHTTHVTDSSEMTSTQESQTFNTYTLFFKLLQLLFQNRQLDVSHCLYASGWTQTIRLKCPKYYMYDHLICVPDPSYEYPTLFIDEVQIATQIVSKILKDSTISPETLIPLPDHVNVERLQESLIQQNQPYQELENLGLPE